MEFVYMKIFLHPMEIWKPSILKVMYFYTKEFENYTQKAVSGEPLPMWGDGLDWSGQRGCGIWVWDFRDSHQLVDEMLVMFFSCFHGDRPLNAKRFK
jgi:hypothetical protein